MIHVLGLGIGEIRFSAEQQALIRSAQAVGGGKRQLEALGIAPERQIVLNCPLTDFAAQLRTAHAHGPVCVVADGDPLLFGIGASLLYHFAASELCFHPHVSALQAAAAKFAIPWHDTRIISLHGRDNLPLLFAALTHDRLLGVYTDNRHSPDMLVQRLLARGVRGWRMHIAEALGLPEERLSSCSLEEASERSWHPLNIIFFVRDHDTASPCFGLAETSLAHQGLISKQPVRALALSLLRLQADSVLWDLGAGSGAISLEAAGLLRQGQVVAVERDASRIANIRENIIRTGAWLVEPVHAELEVFLTRNLTVAPDRIFFGGGATGVNVGQACAALCLGGQIVVSAVLFSTLEVVRQTLENLGWPFTIHQLMHHVSVPLGQDLRLVPDNPVYLITSQKPHPIHE